MKTILVDAIDTFAYEDGTIFQKMYDLLETYPNQKIVVSIANDDQIKQWGLDRLPYELFTMKHNPDKTEPKFFETLLTHFHLQIPDMLYFEHNPEAVKSAESLGIVSYHYGAEKKDLEALKNFLDENLK